VISGTGLGGCDCGRVVRHKPIAIEETPEELVSNICYCTLHATVCIQSESPRPMGTGRASLVEATLSTLNRRGAAPCPSTPMSHWLKAKTEPIFQHYGCLLSSVARWYSCVLWFVCRSVKVSRKLCHASIAIIMHYYQHICVNDDDIDIWIYI